MEGGPWTEAHLDGVGKEKGRWKLPTITLACHEKPLAGHTNNKNRPSGPKKTLPRANFFYNGIKPASNMECPKLPNKRWEMFLTCCN